MCARAPLADAGRQAIIAAMRRDDWTADEILTPGEMAAAERRLIEAGEVEGYALMRRAGEAVAAEITSRYVAVAGYDVLCGPGNNGGDGYVVARLLSEAGLHVATYASGPPRAGTDAERAHADCGLAARPLEAFAPGDGRVVVDALFGGGFRGQLDGAAREAARRCNASAAVVVAIDMPSGLDGSTGAGDPVLNADLTVTFFRPRIGHVLYPGRALCGQLVVADIGIPDAAIKPPGRARVAVANRPGLWRRFLVPPAVDAHKYSRGHCVTFSGGPSATGAARLAAQGAARIGAGAVTVIAPGSALQANAAHLTSIMIARADDAADLGNFLDRRRVAAAVIGPGFGVGERLRDFVKLLAGREDVAGEGATMRLVIDADAITSFAEEPNALFAALSARDADGPGAVLTPHEGEFGRLFPDLAEEPSKLERARRAADRSGAVVVYKGPDTVIAAPGGRAAINLNGTSLLATAGSGDVLAGMIGGLLAQRWPAFEAACAAVWLHAEAARSFGPGLMAEDLPGMLPAVLRSLLDGEVVAR